MQTNIKNEILVVKPNVHKKRKVPEYIQKMYNQGQVDNIQIFEKSAQETDVTEDNGPNENLDYL